MSLFSIAYYCVYVFFAITIVSTIYVIVMENRNPVKSLAWILLLTVMPVVGFLLYIIFGKNFKVKRLINKRNDNELQLTPYKETNHTKESLNPLCRSISELISNTSGGKLSRHNTIETYTSGQEMFEKQMKDIESAKKSILVEYYILEEDRVGNPLIDLLIRKATEGVIVYLIVDDLGSWKLRRKTVKRMREAGIKVFTYLDVVFPFLNSTLNYRNHRKLVVIDSQIVYTGGMNVANRYVYGMSWGVWRDTHLKITGDAAYEYTISFLYDLADCGGTEDAKNLSSLLMNNFENNNKEGKAMLQIVRSGPDMEHLAIMQTYHKLFLSAQRYIYIETPYFMPNEAIREALKTAVLSGVDVRIIIPLHTDRGRFVIMSSYSYVDELSKVGVKFYFYKPGFIHSKMIVCDDEISIVGSANLDFRSLEHNFELNTVIYDQAVVLSHKSIIESDLLECNPMDLDRWQRRSKLMRFNEGVARLLSPLL